MIERETVRDLVTGLFEETAFVLGGLVTIHDIPDEAIWQLTRSLDSIRRQTLRQVDEAQVRGSDREKRLDDPHPAIEAFLARIYEDSRE